MHLCVVLLRVHLHEGLLQYLYVNVHCAIILSTTVFCCGNGVPLLYTMRFRQQMYALQYCISSQLIGAATRPCHQNECPRENTQSKNAHTSDLNYSRRAVWLVFQNNRIVSCKKRNILYFFLSIPHKLHTSQSLLHETQT